MISTTSNEDQMMKRRKNEVLCVHETKLKGDRARKMAEGYKMQEETVGVTVLVSS